MNSNDLMEQIRSAKGLSDYYEFCKVVYQFILEQQPDERPGVLAWFFQLKHEYYGYRNGNMPLSKDLSDQLNDHSNKFKNLIRGLIDFFSIKGYPEKLYYQKLWDSLETLLPDATLEEKGVCLLYVFMDDRTPYYELPVSLQLSNDKFKEISDSIKLSIQQLDFAFGLSKNQRRKSELTSQVVHLLEGLSNFEDKSVLLVYFLNRYEEIWNDIKTKEDRNKTGNSIKPEPGEMSSVEDKNKDTTFLPVSTQDDSDMSKPMEIIANYQYPSINKNEYDFVLIKKGENIFLSDQGKTLKQLDEIFELSEPDVIKNLVAILKHYGAIKQGNEFVIKIDNWNGNINEYENNDIKQGLLSLFSCVSFMLNMKIFYV